MGLEVYNTSNLKETRKELRNNQTKAEKIIWEKLKGSKLLGLKFRRQHSIGRYILDFYCTKLKVAIEIDGEIHEDRKDYDNIRTEYLNTNGIKVIRYSNNQVFNELEELLSDLENKIQKYIPSPPSLPGRGLGGGLKKDFPILQNNKDLIYLDSTATSQKPSYVIDGIKDFLENDYSNIHRGAYSLSEKSEKLYVDSKKIVAKHIGAKSWREVIYSFNSTYAANLLISSLRRSNYFKKGDKVLLSIVEHHANIVPWLILKEELGIEVEFIAVKDDYSLDFNDLEKKLDSNVKAVSITHVSNVTGEIFDLEKIGEIIKNSPSSTVMGSGGGPLFIVDASQSIPHFKVDIEKIGCDFMFFTGHKIMADSGIGVLWGKEDLLKEIKPAFGGGGSISYVKQDCFKEAGLPDRFEPGTPNLSGAVSLLKAFEYLENIGGYEKMEEVENELMQYTLEKFKNNKNVKLIGGTTPESRVGVFSFYAEGIHSHDIAEFLAERNICIRAGQHCAEPLMNEIGVNNSCRASIFLYNTFDDIDKLFEAIDDAISFLR